VFIESGNEKYPGANSRGVYQYGSGNPEHSIHFFLPIGFTESIAGTVPLGFHAAFGRYGGGNGTEVTNAWNCS